MNKYTIRMSMHMSDSNDMMQGAGSSSTRTLLEIILISVNIALAIVVLGFIIGVASIRSRMDGETKEILSLENEILQCEAQLSTTTPVPGVTDDQLRTLTESLLTADVNNVAKEIETNHQNNITSGEPSKDPFFKTVNETALNGTTFQALIKLQSLYNPDVNIAEKLNETQIQAFLSAAMNTDVMQKAGIFLNEYGIYTGNLTTKVREIWFDLYSRGQNTAILGSSGFEHVFAGEIKKGKVNGFHNWVYFYNEEKEQNLVYEGWNKSISLSEKGEVTTTKFEWLNVTKPLGGMFVGTSPELDLAVYTVCFLARPDALCPVKMKNQKFQVQTYIMQQEKKTLVGSAYPVL